MSILPFLLLQAPEAIKDAINWGDRIFYVITGIVSAVVIAYAKNYFSKPKTSAELGRMRDESERAIREDLDTWVDRYADLAEKIRIREYNYDTLFRKYCKLIDIVHDVVNVTVPLLTVTGVGEEIVVKMVSLQTKMESDIKIETEKYEKEGAHQEKK